MTAITVRLLGTVDITQADKGSSETLPRQPKRLAVLAYLATAMPRGFHRRDKLVALFWPEAGQDQARHSLSQALHILRTELGSAAVKNRGDGDVAIDNSSVTIDVVEFEHAVAIDDFERALELYRGDFLDGLFVNDAPEFERWMEDRRTWLKEKAAGAAWALAQQHIAAGRLVDAERTAQQALLLVSTDESQVRRFLSALANAGDRAAAVKFYENFAERLEDEYDIEPAPETVECAESLRSGTHRTEPRVAPESTPSADTISAQATRSRPASGNGAEKRTLLHWRYFMVATAALAVLVVGVATRSGEEAPRRLALLPLQNLSPDPENAFFAAGLHEEILTQLTGIAGIELLGRTSVSRYAGTDKTFTQIAEELRADVIAEGSVQFENARIRITIQLIDPSSGTHMWAERYDRDLFDLFAIQTEVATRIAEALRGTLTPNEVADVARPTQDLEAYTAYLRGHYHSRRFWSVEHAREAAESYSRAVELDPEFEEAWARLVWVRAWLGTQLAVPHQLDSARIALQHLEELSPNSLETLRARGVYLYRTGRYDEGLREFERLREALPRDADVLFNLAPLLRAVGR
jgi:TolB-like protein/DNA-binding SARP family transcriptional activator